MDHMRNSSNFVVVGIGKWLHDGWRHSCPAGHRHHCVSGPAYSGTKNSVSLAGEGEVAGKEVISRPGKILRMARYPH